MKQIYFLITDLCNLSCKHCIRGYQKNNSVTYEQAKKVLHKINAMYKDVCLVLTGGEPTLNKDFEKILKCSAELFSNVIVTTNGTTDFSKVVYYDNVKYQISIDGDSQIHNLIRNQGTYEKILVNIKKLQEKGIRFEVATTVHQKNIYSLKRLYSELVKIGVKCWYVNNLLPIGCAKETGLIPIETKLWNNLTYTMIKNCSEIELHMCTQFDLRERTIKKVLSGEKKCIGCGSGVDKLYIYPDGTVYACTCLVDFPMGNIFTEGFQEILNSDNYKMIIKSNIDEKSVCFTCEMKEICQGGCKGMSYQHFGSLGMGDIRCLKVYKNQNG